MRITSKLIALARSAGALAGVAVAASAERTPEQQAAYAALLAACPNSADLEAVYARAAQADPVKPAAKPQPKADAKPSTGKAKRTAKPEKPSKPANTAKQAEISERVALVGKLRALVSGFYNGPSPAVRSNAKRFTVAIYSDLFAAPKHRTTLAKLTERDESALALILKHGTKAGAFDPVALNLDAGIFSRLCSVGYIIEAADPTAPFALSTAALTNARRVLKRAA